MANQGGEFDLLDPLTITTALTAREFEPKRFQAIPSYLALEAIFTYGSGGTTCKAWVQTSFDGGATWCDVASFAFTTATGSRIAAITAAASFTPAAPTNGSLADNTVNNGLLGNRWRVKVTTTGTYAGGTTLAIRAIAKP